MGLQLTRGGEYASRAMTYMARFPDGHVVSLHEIGQAQEIPESFLAKILQSLVRVRPHRVAAWRARWLRPCTAGLRDHDARCGRGCGRANPVNQCVPGPRIANVTATARCTRSGCSPRPGSWKCSVR